MIASDGWTITDDGKFSGTCGQLGIEDNELDSILLYPMPSDRQRFKRPLIHDQSLYKQMVLGIPDEFVPEHSKPGQRLTQHECQVC